MVRKRRIQKDDGMDRQRMKYDTLDPTEEIGNRLKIRRQL